MGLPLGKVTKEQTRAFGKAWDLNGIKLILDESTLQFATDWANIALKSYYADLQKAVIAVQAKRAATPTDAADVTKPSPPPTVPPSAQRKILLTD